MQFRKDVSYVHKKNEVYSWWSPILSTWPVLSVLMTLSSLYKWVFVSITMIEIHAKRNFKSFCVQARSVDFLEVVSETGIYHDVHIQKSIGKLILEFFDVWSPSGLIFVVLLTKPKKRTRIYHQQFLLQFSHYFSGASIAHRIVDDVVSVLKFMRFFVWKELNPAPGYRSLTWLLISKCISSDNEDTNNGLISFVNLSEIWLIPLTSKQSADISYLSLNWAVVEDPKWHRTSENRNFSYLHHDMILSETRVENCNFESLPHYVKYTANQKLSKFSFFLVVVPKNVSDFSELRRSCYSTITSLTFQDFHLRIQSDNRAASSWLLFFFSVFLSVILDMYCQLLLHLCRMILHFRSLSQDDWVTFWLQYSDDNSCHSMKISKHLNLIWREEITSNLRKYERLNLRIRRNHFSKFLFLIEVKYWDSVDFSVLPRNESSLRRSKNLISLNTVL